MGNENVAHTYKGMLVALVNHQAVAGSVTAWTVARQAPLSMGFLRQEHWSGLSFPSPEDLPNPGAEPASTLAGGFFTAEPPGKLLLFCSTSKWWVPKALALFSPHKCSS